MKYKAALERRFSIEWRLHVYKILLLHLSHTLNFQVELGCRFRNFSVMSNGSTTTHVNSNWYFQEVKLKYLFSARFQRKCEKEGRSEKIDELGNRGASRQEAKS